MSEASHNSEVLETLNIEKAFSNRPKYSIRLRIVIAFSIFFIFSLCITVMSMIFIVAIDKKQAFFEKVEDFSYAIQEARRYEKNYFLYNAKTDLFDALSHAIIAKNVLTETTEEMSSLLKHRKVALTQNMDQYYELLKQLSVPVFSSLSAQKKSIIEEKLRLYGHQVLQTASQMEKEEREKVHAIADAFMLLAIFMLVLNFVVMAWVATELIRQLLRPLGRFVEYTEMIAKGNFTPITPKRKYRDEFSTLAIAINRMIRELKQNQEQLIQSKKMAAIGTLTSGIAHELNNPLNNISITTEALLDDAGNSSDPTKIKMLNDIFTQTERASATVRNLLDFTRMDETRSEKINVQKLIESSLQLVKNELSIVNITVDLSIKPQLADTHGDFTNLQQIFVNLFVNSIHAMPDGGKLAIQASEKNKDLVRISVADTGCGIPEKDLDKIFDPFYTTKEQGKGTGLGLSVSYSIIQKIGGNIKVESTCGEGTTMHVDLPAEQY